MRFVQMALTAINLETVTTCSFVPADDADDGEAVLFLWTAGEDLSQAPQLTLIGEQAQLVWRYICRAAVKLTAPKTGPITAHEEREILAGSREE